MFENEDGDYFPNTLSHFILKLSPTYTQRGLSFIVEFMGNQLCS